jgi:hypothetical protein
MARALSTVVNPLAMGMAIGRGAATAAGATADLGPVAGPATRAAVPAAGGDGGAGAREATGAATGAAAALGADDADPPGARVGSLIVGADVGFGGKLMRTVSFFGWTFEASAGLGGRAPPGVMGLISAISVSLYAFQRKVARRPCQTPITQNALSSRVATARRPSASGFCRSGRLGESTPPFPGPPS